MTDSYDVFISYARADGAKAQMIRDMLQAHNLNVFFDVEGIENGAEFPDVIDRAVKGAKCVLGLWSSNAFAGRWVRIESRIGLDQRKLVAALVDDTRPEQLPAEFYNVNVERLADFQGQPNHAGWNRIVRAIGRRIGREDLAKPPQGASGGGASYANPSPAPARKPAAGAIALVGALAVAVFGYVAYDNFGHSGPKTESADLAPPVSPADASQPETARTVSATDSGADAAAAKAAVTEQRTWDGCERGQIAFCRAYLQQFPNGASAQLASAKIDELTQAAKPALADLSGGWSGYYSGGGNQTTPFEVVIADKDGAFQGNMSENNTFADADRSLSKLYATVAGRVLPGGGVRFTKTYDGTGGQTHSVEYEGTIDDAGRTITGIWKLNGQTGNFRMSRR
ncbi:MAG: toll/interleukin-1 receptor domain-containing protein [Alphaproteobacteria bacterium]